MKKIISLTLAALMLAATFVSCAPAADQLDPAITVASSDAEKYAEWLDGRLDVIPDHVIIGVGSNEKYDVDMSNFDSEGYIARAMNGDVLLFGATDAGLDRAVREYAQAADNGVTDTLDTVFGEGPRIENMTIAGTPIEKFTVVYRYDGGKATTAVSGYTVENASLAADEFIRLMKKATGVTLTAVPHTETVNGPVIMFDYLPEDEEWGDQSYTYEVKDGNLYITGEKKTDGCYNGVYGFFEYECGWDGLIVGDSRLTEAENLDIPNGTSYSADPMFDYLQLGWGWKLMTNKYTNERSRVYAGAIVHACHGIENYYGFDDSLVWPETGICYTSEDTYDLYYDGFKAVVESKKASGLTIGEDWLYQDIAHPDGDHYCKCQTCKNLYRKEGNANSGLVIHFANKVAAQMEEEGFGGLKWLVFAYAGSNKPCKTAPREDVWVTLCTDGACVNHPLSGEDCTGDTLIEEQLYYDDEGGVYAITDRTNNSYFADWIRGWRELTDSLYIWHYGLCTTTYNYTQFDYLYHEWMFLKECGVKGVYFEQEYGGTGFGRIRFQLISWLYWHPDATEEEYNTARAEIMANEYGEGWDLVLDTIGLWRETESTVGCFHCWMFTDHFRLGTYDTEIFAKNADQMYELLDIARKKASCYQQDKNIALLQMEVAYRQCMCTYFNAVAASDEELIDFLNTRYEQFKSLAAYCGLDIKSFGYGYYMGPTTLSDTIEEAAANEWAPYKDELTTNSIPYDYEHVVIIGVDGAGNAWQDADTYYIDEIFANGATGNYVVCECPTISGQNWGSIMTGVSCLIHGRNNDNMAAEPYDSEEYPTFFKLVRDAYPDATLASIVNWNPINIGLVEDDIGVIKQTHYEDSKVKDMAIDCILNEKPNLLYVHFDEVDAAGHRNGSISDGYLDQLRVKDEYIGAIYRAIEDAGIADKTLFIVTADHGHTRGGGHGGTDDLEKYVFFGAAGKSVLPTNDLQMNLRDIPTIVTHALGVEPWENWDAYLPQGLFADCPEPEARPFNSTAGHETLATPAEGTDGYIGNYIDMDKLRTAIFFDDSSADLMGNENTREVGNFGYTDGYYGSAAAIVDGTYLSIPGLKLGTDSFSIGVWMQKDDIYGDAALYSNKAVSNWGDKGITMSASMYMDFNLSDGQVANTFSNGVPVDFQLNNWIHVMVVVDKDAGTVKYYNNFILVREHALDESLKEASFDSGRPFNIGSDGTGGGSIGYSLVDDFLLFDGALSEDEISSLCEYYFK